jgi:uncharacterized protein YhbP (UPF0306 family)
MSDYRETVRTFLKAQSTLSLATVNAGDQPEAVPLFYVSDDALRLYWLSSPNSRHSQNLLAHPRVAGTVYPTVWNWADIVGLQLEGEASDVTDAAQREHILQLYLAKFKLPESFAEAIAASTLFMLRPTWMRWLNNREMFGFKTEIPLP